MYFDPHLLELNLETEANPPAHSFLRVWDSIQVTWSCHTYHELWIFCFVQRMLSSEPQVALMSGCRDMFCCLRGEGFTMSGTWLACIGAHQGNNVGSSSNPQQMTIYCNPQQMTIRCQDLLCDAWCGQKRLFFLLCRRNFHWSWKYIA